jgi:uncharacterized SAM-binding protein YcdF (DUF218 family)
MPRRRQAYPPPVPLLRRALSRDLLRTAGFAVGVFLAVSLAGELVRGPFETFGDWVSWPASRGARCALASVVAAVLIANAPVLRRPRLFRQAATLVLGGVALLGAADVIRFAAVVARGTVRTPALVPASLLVTALFAALAWEIGAARDPHPSGPPRRRARARLAAIAGIVLALPLVRMITFGPSSYERPADVAVVFGARVWNTGRPSLALADRVDEAVRLYHHGLVHRIVMSGAIDEHNGFSEPVVMRDRAEAQGVPREAIVLDEQGVDTASTVRNTARLMRREGMSRALVVTHYYHEPRAKMLFDRAGIAAFTVPATMSRRLAKEPYFLLREVAAYYHSFLLE